MYTKLTFTLNLCNYFINRVKIKKNYCKSIIKVIIVELFSYLISRFCRHFNREYKNKNLLRWIFTIISDYISYLKLILLKLINVIFNLSFKTVNVSLFSISLVTRVIMKNKMSPSRINWLKSDTLSCLDGLPFL